MMSFRLKFAGILGFMLSFLLARAFCNGDSSGGKSIGTSAGERCKQFTFSVADLKDSNKMEEIENFFREQLGNLDAAEHVTVKTTILHQNTHSSTPFPTMEVSTPAPEGTIISTYVSTSLAKEIPFSTAVQETTSETTAHTATVRQIETTASRQYSTTTSASTTSQLETTTEAYHSTGTRSAEVIRLVQEGWNRASNGYLYKFFGTAKTWPEAKKNCSEKGAILASAVIREAAIRQEIFADIDGYNAIWIGLSDIDQEDKWMWEDGVESTGNDVNWKAGEPNDDWEKEDCGYYSRSDLRNWSANDVSCTNYFKFLCEKSPGS